MNNLECGYSISMTGKVQGANRSKRARSESNVNNVNPNNLRTCSPALLDTINMSCCDDANIVAHPAATQPVHMPPSLAVTGDAEDIRHPATIELPPPTPESALRWPVPDSFSADIFFDINDSLFQPSANEPPHSQQRPECQEARGQLPTSRHGEEACITRNASREPGNSGTPEAQLSLSSASSARDRLPLNCNSLLEQLWQREGCAHLQPDMIMATNKTAVSDLSNSLPALDSCDKSGPDLMLYTLVMQAIVNSYRQVCDSWLQAGSDVSRLANNGILTPSQHHSAGFTFGAFEIDAESQRKLFAQVMLREINMAMLLWSRIWAVVSSEQLNGRGGSGICENILLDAGVTLKRIITEISTSVAAHSSESQ